MDLERILTIPGKPSLYKLLSQSKVSAIVENLQDKKRFPVFGLDKVSSLSEIAIYTQSGEISLPNVFRAMHKALEGKKTEDQSKIKDFKEYFAKFVPDFDTERVYDSNIKKVFAWYNLLLDNGLINQELSEREKAQQEGLAKHEAEEKAAAKAESKEAAKPAPKAKKTEVPKAKPAVEKAAKPKAAAGTGTKGKATVKKTSASAK